MAVLQPPTQLPGSPESARDVTTGARAALTRLARALSAEPRWLRGVTPSLLAMTLFLAALQNLPQILRVVVPNHVENAPWQFALFDLACQLAVGVAILLIAAFLINLRKPRMATPLALAIAVIAGSVLPVNAFAYLLNHGTGGLLFPMSIARRVAIPWGIAAAAWYFLERASARQAALREADVACRRLEAGVIEAQLQALQAQVEPHFLFNTLAHLRHLYRTDPLRARLMLDSFRAYLESALPRMRGVATTLGQELDLVATYLDVQRVRMGQRLVTRVDVPARLRDCEIPAMMLLSLVENAIKHGLNPLPAGGTVAISAMERAGGLEVCVADTGCGMGLAIGSGTGLANIRARLAALHGAAAGLALARNGASGVRATITVPLRLSPRDDSPRAGHAQAATATP